MRDIASIGELRALIGGPPLTGEWMTVTQERIDAFAAATGDFQWIHVDRSRPGVRIAHGFLTLSLLPAMLATTLRLHEPLEMTLNYGLNRLRFTSAVAAGSRVRNASTPLAIEDDPRGWKATWRHVVEIEGSEKPALVAEQLVLYVRATAPAAR
jgi:acyl dehydratase